MLIRIPIPTLVSVTLTFGLHNNDLSTALPNPHHHPRHRLQDRSPPSHPTTLPPSSAVTLPPLPPTDATLKRALTPPFLFQISQSIHGSSAQDLVPAFTNLPCAASFAGSISFINKFYVATGVIL